MYIMISYDVSSDKRRRKLYRVLRDYGRWVQYSLFECRVTKQQLAALRARMAAVPGDDTDDRILICDVCADCEGAIEQIGVPPEEEAADEALLW